MKFGNGFSEASLNVFKEVNVFLSVRGPDRGSVFKDYSYIYRLAIIIQMYVTYKLIFFVNKDFGS